MRLTEEAAARDDYKDMIRHACVAVLSSRVALLDRPKHRFLEFLEDHVIGIANGLQLRV